MEKLREETLKFLEKINPLIEKIEIVDERGNEMMTNMKAYIEDSKHFMKEGDLVRAFECVVWAWAILEICEDLGVFKVEK